MGTYNKIAEYVSGITYSSRVPELFFFNQDTLVSRAVNIDVETKSNKDDNLYYVIVKVKINDTIEDGSSICSLTVDYDVLVECKNSVDDDVLTIDIPQEVYPHIQQLVLQTTKLFKNPIFLPDYSFRNRQATELNLDDAPSIIFVDEPDTSVLTFKKLFEDIFSSKEGAGFLETMNKRGAKFSLFDDFMLTRVLFQYMPFTDYNVCEELEHDEYSKRIMFYLIASSDECSWNLCKGKNGLIDLKYSFKSNKSDKLSSLSPDEFFNLASDIIVSILTNTCVKILEIELGHGEFDEPYSQPSLAEYREAFSYSQLSHDKREFVDSLYRKISKVKTENLLIKL